MKNKKNVLFLTSGSLRNPIIHSQGIPHILKLQKFGFRYEIGTLENFYDSREEKNEYAEIVKKMSLAGAPVHSKKIKIKKSIIPRLFKTIYHLSKLLFEKGKKYDIIHCRAYEPTLAALLVKKVIGGKYKVLFDMRGLWTDELIVNGSRKRDSLLSKIDLAIEKYLVRKSDAIVVMNENFKNVVMSRYPEVSSSKIKIIQNSYNPERFPNIKFTERGENNKPVFGYMGSVSPWQKIDVMIEIFDRLNELNNGEIEFKIATYQKSDYLKSLVGKSKYKERIEIVNLKPDDIPSFLSLIDIGFNLHGEALTDQVASPTKFAEYLASGVPVIINRQVVSYAELTERYGVGYVIENYKNILIPEINNFTRKVMENREYYFDLCKKTASEHFHLDDAVRAYASLLEELSV